MDTRAYRNAPPPVVEQGAGQGHGAEGFSSTPVIVADNPVIVKLNIDSKPYSSKEDAKRDIRIIRSRLCSSDRIMELDARRLSVAAAKGYSWTPAVMTGTSGDTWQEQRIFSADIDNKDKDGNQITPSITPADAIEKMEAAGIHPLFIYNSFSDTAEWPRFRVVIATTETITDRDEAGKITLALQSVFGDANDDSTKDPARLFYGTNKGLALEYTGQTTPAAVLLDLYRQRVEPEQVTLAPSYTAHTVRNSDHDLAYEIDHFNMTEYVQRTTNSRSKRAGGKTLFNPCPLCGHNDDFYTDGAVFKCFGSGCGEGGNIINYLEILNGWDRKQAREYFMHDILGWDREEARKEYKEVRRAERAVKVAGNDAVKRGEVPPYVVEVRNEKGEVTKTYISAPLLAQHIREHEHYIFVRAGANTGVNRFWYTGGYYKQVSDDEIRGIIKLYIEKFDLTLLRMRDVNEVFQQLVTDRVFHGADELNAQEHLINFRNGILDLETAQMMPHDPKYYMTRQIPVDFSFDCGTSPVFDDYMKWLCCGKRHDEEWTEDGEKRYQFLMEFLGACISNVRGWRFKKSLFMVGPGDTGKSQLKSLAEYLIGAENCNPCDLGTLEARFGSAGIYNKRLVGSSDMPFLTIDQLDIFKQITGGDAIFAEYKGKDAFSFTYDGFSWFCMNRLPRFGGDNGRWVYDRIIPFECPYVVPDDMRDRQLLDKMKAEAPAIVCAAVGMFWSFAVRNGYKFDEPDEAETMRNSYQKTNNTVQAWIDECCIEVKNPQGTDWATVADWEANRNAPSINTMYRLYKEWCADYEGGYYLKRKDFFAEIENTYGVNCKEKRASGMVFTCICLNDEYKNKIGGSYNV